MIATVLDLAFFNAFGISVTKYASAAQRSTIDTSMTVSIWVLSVLLGLESFVPLEIPGFIVLAFGTLLYNEIIVIPFLGFDQNTKDAIAKREGEEAAGGTRDSTYVGSSPHAVYDQNRFNRRSEALKADAILTERASLRASQT